MPPFKMKKNTSTTPSIISSLLQSIPKTIISYALFFGFLFFLGYQFFNSKSESSTIEYDTNIIQKQILNVGKLVVTEGHFSEVITYKDKKKYLMDMISFEKKAIVVINAEATVSFDLSKMKYDIDAKNKTLTITYIPKEELKISPDIKFYDVEQSTLNEFTGDDYNKINKIVRANLTKKLQNSSLITNSKNRLVSELSKILILTNSMGWKLQYNGNEISTTNELLLKLKP
jgi:hypothetical protein